MKRLLLIVPPWVDEVPRTPFRASAEAWNEQDREMRDVKRTITIALALLLICGIGIPAVLAEEKNPGRVTPRLRMYGSNLTAGPDQNVTWTVSMYVYPPTERVQGLSLGVYWYHGYPESDIHPEYLGWTPGTDTQDALITVSESDRTEGLLQNEYYNRIMWSRRMDVAVADPNGFSGWVDVLNLQFRMPSEFTEHSVFFQIFPREVVRASRMPYDLENGEGYIWIAQLWGDCDHDGRLTSNDARMALQMVNWEIDRDHICDITRDGFVGLDDAVEIMEAASNPIEFYPFLLIFTDVTVSPENEETWRPPSLEKDSRKSTDTEASPTPVTTTPTPASPSCSTYVKPVISTGVLSICRAGQTLCKTGCANLLTDAANCGGCGKVCGSHEICSNGDCVCSKGYTLCKSGCANLLTDAANCGGCGVVCGLHETCVNGECICSKGYTLCKSGCANLLTDAANCGVCGKACGSHETCVNGECICSKSYTLCKTGCANLLTDAANCGTCGKICLSGLKCVNGACSGGLVKSIS